MSCLPPTWKEVNKRKSAENKKSSNELPTKRARKRFEFQNTEQHNNSVRELLQRLRQQASHVDVSNVLGAKSHNSLDLTVEATVMMSSVPFLEHLSHLDDSLAQHDIPVVTRAYEEGYMRGRLHDGESECAMKSECECMMLDPKNRFVCVQFEIPCTTGEFSNNLCIFCLRKITLLLFYEALLKGMPIGKPIQKHGNITGQADEYHPSAMLMCPKNGPIHCMPLPIVAHQRNALSVEMVAGVPYVRQHGVYMENFCQPLS